MLQEDAVLIEAHGRLGNRWTEISKIFGDRWAPEMGYATLCGGCDGQRRRGGRSLPACCPFPSIRCSQLPAA